MTRDSDDWVLVGKIVGAHGLRGELKLHPYVDDLDFLRALDTLYLKRRSGPDAHTLQKVRFHKGNALLTLESVADRTAAEGLRGREVMVPLRWLPDLEEDEYYVAEIVGLHVVTTEGEALGEVTGVLFTGANEVYVVEGERGEILLPAIESVVREVNLDGGQLLVDLPEGLIDGVP